MLGGSFLSVEVLYDAMSDGAWRLTVEEFFHCYHLVEVSQSKGMYNFTPRSLLLRLICENLDSNRDWKSRYFFLEDDEWMCHPGDNEFMPVDKTWGIMPPSGMRPSTNIYFCFNFSSTHKCSSFYAARDRPLVSLEQFSFLEKIFNKTKLEEKTWAKLVNLDTLNWYCDGPEPTIAARRYEAQVCQRKSVTLSFCYAHFRFLTSVLYFAEMDAAKIRAYIKQQAAMKKQVEGTSKGTGSSNPSTKRKPQERVESQSIRA